jgi:hypothetical protein
MRMYNVKFYPFNALSPFLHASVQVHHNQSYSIFVSLTRIGLQLEQSTVRLHNTVK